MLVLLVRLDEGQQEGDVLFFDDLDKLDFPTPGKNRKIIVKDRLNLIKIFLNDPNSFEDIDLE